MLQSSGFAYGESHVRMDAPFGLGWCLWEVLSIRLQVTRANYAKDLGGKVKFCFSCMDERTWYLLKMLHIITWCENFCQGMWMITLINPIHYLKWICIYWVLQTLNEYGSWSTNQFIWIRCNLVFMDLDRFSRR